ncbi:hypothetical protein [Thalassospira sp.]|uniref:hypothetical protein n=1 Tax=Thalassospira sp. TaxID=1912094 RepID=UPI001B215374|nr:hypothetical protein [Thalassospira sp.]MBO6809235.1 hypothetical protein [Thalassospira sp.]MBO6841194.1 hypothetical protein [Thalassospira sp.]
MPLRLFLNDLSIPEGLLAREQSIRLLKKLVSTVREAHCIDTNLELYSEVGLSHFSLGEGTTVASLRNDGNCVEESQFLKRVNDRAPIKLSREDGGDPDPSLREYKLLKTAPVHAGQEAIALGFSHALKGLGLSLDSHEFWQAQSIQLNLIEFDDSEELIASLVSTLNASSPDTVRYLQNDIRALFQPNFNGGAELWARREELLPNLTFIPRTRHQIQSIQHGEPLLAQTWIKLSGINQAIENWKSSGGSRPLFPFNVRAESRTRLNLVQFRDCNGVIREFSDHCDLAPTECRIHFIIEQAPTPHVLIGHVGRKLGIG